MITFDATVEQEELKYGLGLESQRLFETSKASEFTTPVFDWCSKTGADYVEQYCANENISVGLAFFDSVPINGKAFSRRRGGHEYRFATISSGAIVYLSEFFYYLMSRTDVLPSIGLCTLERNLPYRLRISPKISPLEELRANGLLKSIRPVDPVRREFAEIMIFAASQYLVFHELAHCVNGHVTSLSFVLDEIDQLNDAPSAVNLRNHTLEMDADAFASSRMFDYIITPGVNISGTWGGGLAHSYKRTYPAIVAIIILFRLMSRPETLPLGREEYFLGKHPHAFLRSHFFLITLLESFRQKKPETEMQEFLRISAKAKIDVWKMWGTLTGTKDPLRALIYDDQIPNGNYDQIGKYLVDLLEEWREARRDLTGHALIKLVESQ